MIHKELEVNQKIEIVVEDGPYSGIYLSKIAEISERYIKIIAPFVHGELLPLRINQTIKIFFTGESSAYMFNARILARETEPLALLTITKPTDIVRIQRREYFRVNAKKRVKYRLISDINKDNSGEEDYQETMTVDISGGGIKMVVGDNFPSRGRIELYLDLPEVKSEPIQGEIVAIYSLPGGKAAGINFTEITDYAREKIISWLFNYQRELRQKGLL